MASPVKDAKLRAQQIWLGATVVARGKGWLRHQHPTEPDKFMLETTVGNRGWHFGDGPFTSAHEVDTAWIDADPVLDAPYQKKMILADYHVYFGPGYTNFRSDPLIKYVHPASGESVTFQPMGLYFSNNLDDEQQISEPTEVAVSIVDDLLTWVDAYGSGIDFQWQNQAAALAKFISINSLAELGSPLPYIIAGGNPTLRVELLFEKSAGLEIWVDGVLWDEKSNNPQATLSDVEFRLAGEPIWYFRSPRVSDSEGDMASADIEMRLRKSATDLFVEIRVPWSWLETAIYPVIIDPTIEPTPGASGDDYAWRSGLFSSTDVNLYLGMGATDQWNLGIRFIDVTLSGTIDVAYVHMRSGGTQSGTVCLARISGDDSDNPSAPTSEAQANAITLTTNYTDWTVPTMSKNTWYDTPSIVDVIQELVDTYTISGDAVQVIMKDNGSDVSAYRQLRSYDAGNLPVLHIEYTEGAGPQTISMGVATLESSAQGLNVIPGAKSVEMSEATLVSAPQALTVDAPIPPLTVSMSAATLVSDPQALSVLPGGVTIPMSEATLVGAPQALTALVSGGPLTISMAVATLVAAAQALDVKPGAVSVPMSEATLVSVAQALDVIPGAATVPMNAATLVSAAQALDLILGAISVPMSAVTLASAAQALNVDAATGATISMSVATLVAAAQGLSVVPGGVSIPLGDVELAGSAQALTVVTPISGTIIPMSAITLVSAAQGLTVIPPAPTIAMSPTTLVGSAQALTAKPGGVTIPLSAITLVSSAQAATLVAIARIGLQAVTLQAQPQALRLVAGQVVIPMQAVTLAAVLVTLNRVGLPYAAFFRIYALLGEHIPETAYNLQGEHIVAGTLEGEHIPETEVEIDGEV